MPSRRAPATPLGGATSLRHAELLLHLVQPGGDVTRASVKDLRLRRVIPPSSAPLDSSPERAATTLGSFKSTPPEAAAVDDRERRPMLAPCSRSKLVRDPASFGYRRLLPFLTAMAKDEASIAKNVPKEIEEFRQNNPPEDSADAPEAVGVSVDESVDGSHCGVDPSGAAESVVVKTGNQETKSQCDNVKGDTNPVCNDTSGSKPRLLRCSRSRFVHHPSSFSYKRLLPFITEIVSPQEEGNAEVERIIEESPLTLAGNNVLADRQLQLDVFRMSPQEDNTARVQQIIQEKPLTSDGDDEKSISSDESDVLPEAQPLRCVMEELLPAQLQNNADFSEVQQCQSSHSDRSDVCFASPTKIAVQHNAPELQNSMVKSEASINDPLEVEVVCRPSDPGAVEKNLSMEEIAGCVPHVFESGSRKVGTLRPRGILSLEKKTLSPKKGILKRHTRGCKGICMCLDCTTFRLHADRSFEFSRKQMQESDDIIEHLLNELSRLRYLIENSAGQELTREACHRASRVEEVARDRRQHMFLDLNSHCRIPGPRVTFAQYIEEKMASSQNSDRR